MRFIRLVSLVAPLILVAAVSSCQVVPKIGAAGGFDRSTLGEQLELALEDPTDPRSIEALGEFVVAWHRERGRRGSGEINEPGLAFEVRFSESTASTYSMDYFDHLRPAPIPSENGTRSGIGVPLIALRENLEREPIERFYPPEAIARTVTAVAIKGPTTSGVQQVRIELIDPMQRETVDLDGRSYPLAADFLASQSALLKRANTLRRSRIVEVLRVDPKRDPQLYLMQPYDPEKIPLLMIHGLFDTPLTWAEVTREIYSDAELRDRYQVWHYLYNTSAPALYSGRILQQQLPELRPLLDPTGMDPAMQSTTLLTHSMGGIVGKRLITEPGDAFWEVAFTRPIEALRLSPEDRASLEEAFFWKAEPYIDRVIFAAVPHRGSRFAENFIGQLGRALVQPPSTFQRFYADILEDNPGAFTEAYQELGEGQLDSVHSLSPEQPTLTILAELRPVYDVDVHSVIGDRGQPGPVEESSDGIVDYWSSHVEWADSEGVVPTGHRVIHAEKGIEAILQLLRQE